MPEPQTSKDRMIRVAIDLFSSKGFKGTSIRDIASALGMSISNIYHYFGNKEGLWLAILEHSARGILDKLRQVSELDMEPLARFKHLLETHICLSDQHRKEGKIFFIDEEHLTPEGIRINRELQRGILEIYINELRNLEAAGYVNCRSLTVLAFNILGVINWQLRWYRPEGGLSLEEISKEIVSFVMHGILRPDTQGKEPAVS
ncbi:MAG: TetR family transcriptional regulator [Deltaproteobacteria bacterium]|nr:MAG: TetR family transcriptional regulator [Deltaproteobacteria bacterium]